MTAILLVVVLLVIAAGALWAIKWHRVEGQTPTLEGIYPLRAVVIAMVVVLAVVIISAVGQVEAGHRGVVLRFGAVTNRTLNEGLYFVTPFVESVVKLSVQTEALEAAARAASKDLQDVSTTVTLNYSLDPAAVNRIYQDLRLEYVRRIVSPAIQESVKSVAARFDAEQLITERPTVKTGIEEVLRARLSEHGILVDTINITDFQFSATFAQSIEAKVVAAQSALEAENRLRQIEVEARQAEQSARGRASAAIAEAEGQRQSAILQAQGQAEATLLRANAQAEANRLIDSTLTEQVIRYTLVNELGEDIKVIVLPAGQQFILGEAVLGGAATKDTAPSAP